MWTPSIGVFSQAADSSSGDMSSDQEKASIYSLGQSRGMNSDGLLQQSKSHVVCQPPAVGETPWQVGSQKLLPVTLGNAKGCFIQCMDGDGDPQTNECNRRGSSTTGTRTTGGTTYNSSECSSPKGGAAGLSFSNQTSFGPLAGSNTFISNGNPQIQDL